MLAYVLWVMKIMNLAAGKFSLNTPQGYVFNVFKDFLFDDKLVSSDSPRKSAKINEIYNLANYIRVILRASVPENLMVFEL